MTDQTQAATTALVTIDPESFVTQVFAETNKSLETALTEATAAVYDVKTKEGMEIAKHHRATLRTLRTSAEDLRKRAKAPILDAGKLLDTRYKEIEAKIVPVEDKIDDDIKVEERRIAEEKAAKIRAEEERKAQVQSAIDAITRRPLEAINMTADQVESLIEELSQKQPTKDEFDERHIEAEVAINSAIAQLKGMLEGKKAQETLAQQQEAQRAENERQQQEQGRINAIQAKIAAMRNVVMDAAECDASADVQKLIDQTEALEITEADYQEFTDEAKAAKERVLKALGNQLTAQKNAESIAAAAKAEALSEEKSNQEEKPSVSTETTQSVVPASVAAEFTTPANEPIQQAQKPSNVRYFEGIRPSDTEIIDVVAEAFGTKPEVARQWLVDSFGMKAAA
jgi:DNA repair exonuclease SbcCD ATPase subunit